MKWWGYLHENGTIQAKRFFDTTDVIEARTSPFVQRVIALSASCREEALETLKERI